MAHLQLSTGGGEWLPATVDLYKDAFATDPVLTFFRNHLPAEKQKAFLPRLLTALIKAAALNHGIFYYAQHVDGVDLPGNSAVGGCRAVLMPPGTKLDGLVTIFKAGIVPLFLSGGPNDLISLMSKILGDYQAQTSRAKTKALKKGEKYYYVYWIATAEKDRGTGLSSEVIRKVQERARADDMPVWLEATTPYSASIYAKLGFETVETFRLGIGKVDAKGLRTVAGEGVPVCAMLWRPLAEAKETI